MTLKDFSFELKPAYVDGVAKLVDRLQVDTHARRHYLSQPYLKCHVSETNGCMDVPPHRMCARLLSVGLGPGMDQKIAVKKINRPIQEKLKQLARRPSPKLEFSVALHQGEEC